MQNNLGKVLVVEDDLHSRKILETIIKKWNFEVLTATNGEEALGILKRDENIHLVISDWMMPGMDGIELCKKVRDLPDRYYTYFIILTAKTETSDVIAGMEAGADDFITKPFNQHELRVRLHAGARVVNLEHQLAAKAELLRIANDQMGADLKAAAAIQRSMLPPMTGIRNGVRYATKFIPSQDIGGDILNLLSLGDDSIMLYICDVSGHGVSAALQSVALGRMLSHADPANEIFLQKHNEHGSTVFNAPSYVASQLNSRFQSTSAKADFITLFYGVLNNKSRELHYTRAGHPAPIIISGSSTTMLDGASDIPIGILPDYEFKDHSYILGPGDKVFIYTDGLSEAANSAGERFGEEKLIEYLLRYTDMPLDKCIDSLMQSVIEWRGSSEFEDDLSILAIELPS